MKKRILLILDADDTLWESALFFERTEHDFLELMQTLGFGKETVQRIVHRKDAERLSATGYGAQPYVDTLRHIMLELVPKSPSWAITALKDIESALLGHPVILMPGVRETLESIRSFNIHKVIYTMGERKHQLEKFMKSGLSDLVDEMRIVSRKTISALEELLESFEITPDRCILVGNSPRSDINPALALGVSAVHVVRDRTWVVEREDFTNPGLVRTIEEFNELLDILNIISSD